jgi:hypothetical protein
MSLLQWIRTIVSGLRQRIFETAPSLMTPTLTSDFPAVRFRAADGQQWRIHPAEFGAWYFASMESHPEPADVGRFDLPAPMGTCYVGAYDDAVTMEASVLRGLSPEEQAQALADRKMSAMALDDFWGRRIADFASPDIERFGVPRAVEQLDRLEARPWAQAAYEAGFAGIRYRLRKDPDHRIGLALFGPAGPRTKPATQGEPQPFVVGQIHLAGELANGQFGGDPLAE